MSFPELDQWDWGCSAVDHSAKFHIGCAPPRRKIHLKGTLRWPEALFELLRPSLLEAIVSAWRAGAFRTLSQAVSQRLVHEA